LLTPGNRCHLERKSRELSTGFSRPRKGLDVAAKLLEVAHRRWVGCLSTPVGTQESSLRYPWERWFENGCGTDNDGTDNDWNAIKGDITQCLKQEDPMLSKLTIPITVFLRNTARGVCQVARQRLGLPTDANP